MSPADSDTSPLVIDIKTRFLRDDIKVYIIFPGSNYRYFEMMREKENVFLEFPGFPAFASGKIPSRSEIIKGIVISDRVRDWHRKESVPQDEPERDPTKVTNFAASKRRLQLAAVFENFFLRLQKGDVIVVPGRGENAPVLFGEMNDDAGSCTMVRSNIDYDELIPARKVRWITGTTRALVPRWLDRKLPSQNPVRQIERDYHSQIFDLMYERYYYSNRFVTKFKTSSTDFSTLDNYILNQVFLYVSALHENLEEGNITHIGTRSLFDVVSSLEFSDDIPDQRIIIQSPGFIVLETKNIVPLVIGVFMALSASHSSSDAGQVHAPAPPRIINSVDDSQASSQCVDDVQAETIQDLHIMGHDRWREMCLAEARARARTQIDSGMSVSGGAKHGR